METDEIVKNTENILKRLQKRSAELGRDICLVGATKTRTAEEINAAISAGLKMVGENRPQEFRDKFPLISPDAEKHFIGHLQENKVKYVVGKASLIHSCDGLPLAYEISRQAKKLGVVQDVLIEVNIAGEADKHGFLTDEVFNAAQKLKSIENLRFRGLMTVLPHVETEAARPFALHAQDIFVKLKEKVFGDDFKYLSMGMSEDYELAIDCGSNMVRLGRAIFGERN